jgi:tRNA-dihydrouridine synthase
MVARLTRTLFPAAQGTLPLRLLSLRYGADLVYTEAILDKRIIYSTRVVNGARLRLALPPLSVV